MPSSTCTARPHTDTALLPDTAVASSNTSKRDKTCSHHGFSAKLQKDKPLDICTHPFLPQLLMLLAQLTRSLYACKQSISSPLLVAYFEVGKYATEMHAYVCMMLARVHPVASNCHQHLLNDAAIASS